MSNDLSLQREGNSVLKEEELKLLGLEDAASLELGVDEGVVDEDFEGTCLKTGCTQLAANEQ